MLTISGRVLENRKPDFDEFVAKHNVKTLPGMRAIITVDIHQVGSSCGFSVPYYDFKDFRPILNDHFAKKEKRFQEGKTDESIDRYLDKFINLTRAIANSCQILGLQECLLHRRIAWNETRS